MRYVLSYLCGTLYLDRSVSLYRIFAFSAGGRGVLLAFHPCFNLPFYSPWSLKIRNPSYCAILVLTACQESWVNYDLHGKTANSGWKIAWEQALLFGRASRERASEGSPFPCPSRLPRSLVRSRETHPNRRACSQASWKVKWFAPFRLGFFRKYGLWFEASKFSTLSSMFRGFEYTL